MSSQSADFNRVRGGEGMNNGNDKGNRTAEMIVNAYTYSSDSLVTGNMAMTPWAVLHSIFHSLKCEVLDNIIILPIQFRIIGNIFFRPAQVVKVFFAITTWISYALQGYVTAHILWDKYLVKHFKESRQTLYELIFRVIIVLLTCK